ncbi:MAG: SCO family protein [Actinobacteria bacterium]|nr:SCO family protein [Actinomycetota bacterium]
MTQPPRRRGRLASVAAAGACAIAVTACGAAAGSSTTSGVVDVRDAQASRLHGTEIGDVIRRPAMRLRDTSGALFDLRARPRGELTMLFFGYTRCPDVCPTTMADLAAARRAAPADMGARVRVVFVTEDPRRDAPPALRAWLDRYDPGFVGLIGGNPASAAALNALKAPATEVQPDGPSPAASRPGGSGDDDQPGSGHHAAESGTVAHTGSVYAFVGDRVVVYTGGTTPREYAADFRELLP